MWLRGTDGQARSLVPKPPVSPPCPPGPAAPTRSAHCSASLPLTKTQNHPSGDWSLAPAAGNARPSPPRSLPPAPPHQGSSGTGWGGALPSEGCWAKVRQPGRGGGHSPTHTWSGAPLSWLPVLLTPRLRILVPQASPPTEARALGAYGLRPCRWPGLGSESSPLLPSLGGPWPVALRDREVGAPQVPGEPGEPG